MLRRIAISSLGLALLFAGLGSAFATDWPDDPGSPQLLVRPSIRGTPRPGRTLTADKGTWAGATGYLYAWDAKDARHTQREGRWAVVRRGPNARRLTVTRALLGRRLRLRVTAINAHGRRTAFSVPTAPVSAGAPPVGPPPVTTSATTTTTSTVTSESTSTAVTTTATTTPTTATTTTTTTTATTTTTPAPPPAGPCGTATGAPPATYAHVVWIWMENKSYGSIIGANAAPYENTLANECGLATNYSAITHPSLPNYIAATSGSTQGIGDDAPPSSHPLVAPSIFGQVSSASYEESMPTNCATTDAYPYAVRHNPEAYYVPTRAQCQAHNLPLTALGPDTLPQFSFVTPNLCHDTHDCGVATGDDWLKSFVPQILATADYRAGRTVVFITWDEDDESSSNHVPLIVLSATTPAGARRSTALDHYSLLGATESMLGAGCLGSACNAASLRTAFGL